MLPEMTLAPQRFPAGRLLDTIRPLVMACRQLMKSARMRPKNIGVSGGRAPHSMDVRSAFRRKGVYPGFLLFRRDVDIQIARGFLHRPLSRVADFLFRRFAVEMFVVGLRIGAGVVDHAVPMMRGRINRIKLQ